MGRNVPDDLNLHQHRCENFTTTNCCPKTLARNYQSMTPKIPKECRSHLHHIQSLKSHNCGSVMFSLLCWSCICWSFQIKENYPTTGKGQEEIGWNPSLVEAGCDEISQLRTECLVNILTATNRTLQCASVAGFFQIHCCVCSEAIMARRA